MIVCWKKINEVIGFFYALKTLKVVWDSQKSQLFCKLFEHKLKKLVMN